MEAALAELADAAIPARVARLEAGRPADAAARVAGYADELGGRGTVLHLGAGSGWALGSLGPGAEGVEASADLAAEADRTGRSVRHGDPLAHLAALAPGSLGGVLVTDLVERLDGAGLAALCSGLARALRADGAVVVEGLRPEEPAGEAASGREPDGWRALHPDAVLTALEAAGLSGTRVEAAGAGRYAVHARR